MFIIEDLSEESDEVVDNNLSCSPGECVHEPDMEQTSGSHSRLFGRCCPPPVSRVPPLCLPQLLWRYCMPLVLLLNVTSPWRGGEGCRWMGGWGGEEVRGSWWWAALVEDWCVGGVDRCVGGGAGWWLGWGWRVCERWSVVGHDGGRLLGGWDWWVGEMKVIGG